MSSSPPRFVLPGSNVHPSIVSPPSAGAAVRTNPLPARLVPLRLQPPSSRPLTVSSPERLRGSPSRNPLMEADHVKRPRIIEASMFEASEPSLGSKTRPVTEVLLDVIIGGVNYALFEAAGTTSAGRPMHRLEDIVRGELLGALHKTAIHVREDHISFEVTVQPGFVSSLALEVGTAKGRTAPSSAEDHLEPTVSIVGGLWPLVINVIIKAASEDDAQRMHVHYIPALKRWLCQPLTVAAVSQPFQDALLFVKSILGPDARACPRIIGVRFGAELELCLDEAVMLWHQSSLRTRQHGDESRSPVQPTKNTTQLIHHSDHSEGRGRRLLGNDSISHGDSGDGDEITSPRAPKAHISVASEPSQLQKKQITKSIFVMDTVDSARSSLSPRISSPSVESRAEKVTPHRVSQSRGRSSGGSLLLRVSTSPMRSEDYYVVGGVQLNHVEVALRVPVVVQSWRVCGICERKLRGLLLSRREMLEYYARDDLYDLLSSASCDPTQGGSPRSAQAILNCARHVVVSLDVLGPDAEETGRGTGGEFFSIAPTIAIVFVCSILCESLVERLLVSELWASVARERALMEAGRGTQIFRRLLKELASLIAGRGLPPNDSRNASLGLDPLLRSLDALPSLVVSVPASLKGCQLSIGGHVAWSVVTTQQLTGQQPARPSPTPPAPPMHSPEMTVHVLPATRAFSATSRQATHVDPRQPALSARQQEDDQDDREPTPIPLSASPTPLRSPSSVDNNSLPGVTLVLVFPQMPLQPLQKSMKWWKDNQSRLQHHSEFGFTERSPAEQLLRACHFDLLDGLQEYCFEPDDCIVTFAVPSSWKGGGGGGNVSTSASDVEKFGLDGGDAMFMQETAVGATSSTSSSRLSAYSSNKPLRPAGVSSSPTKRPLRLLATVRASSSSGSGAEDVDAFHSAVAAYCTESTQFAALRDVYLQICLMDGDQRLEVPQRLVFPFLDLDESTFNGIPLGRMQGRHSLTTNRASRRK